jgi:hypothetical protein
MVLSFCNFCDWLVHLVFVEATFCGMSRLTAARLVVDREFSREGASMRVRKMVVAAGVIALAAAGCGSAKSSGAQPGEVTPTSTKQGRTVQAIKECLECETQSGLTATVPYEFEYDGKKTTTALAVTAVSVEKAAITDLKGFNLDADEKATDPYYVTMKYRNTGKSAVSPYPFATGVSAKTSGGTNLRFFLDRPKDFPKCDEGDLPETLAPGAEYTGCGVYGAPAGQDVANVLYSAKVDSYTREIEVSWSVG